MKCFVCFAALLAVAFAVEGPQCPDFEVQDPFLLANFTGTWYEQYALNTKWEVGTCVQTTYTLNETTGELATDTSYKTESGEVSEVTGSAARTIATSTDGKLTLTHGNDTRSLWILTTDYDNYAVIYSCAPNTQFWYFDPTESIWVLTREQTLTDDVSLLIKAAGVSVSDLTRSSQENCS